jgi:hypothetical protein
MVHACYTSSWYMLVDEEQRHSTLRDSEPYDKTGDTPHRLKPSGFCHSSIVDILSK